VFNLFGSWVFVIMSQKGSEFPIRSLKTRLCQVFEFSPKFAKVRSSLLATVVILCIADDSI
jgi:hypothetical protein